MLYRRCDVVDYEVVLMRCQQGIGIVVFLCIFFFKQMTAYEILSGLLGSEMCMKDSDHATDIPNLATLVFLPASYTHLTLPTPPYV